MRKPKKLYRFWVKQYDKADCGVACLLTIIKYYSGYCNVDNLRRFSGTSAYGTTMLGLLQAANQLGFKTNAYQASVEEIAKLNIPSILHVTQNNNLHHYVVCYGTVQSKNCDKFIISDPANGIIYLSPDEVDNLWKSKTCLLLEPNEHFRTTYTVRNAKLKWIKELIKDDIALLSLAAIIGVAIAFLSLSMAVFTQRLIDDMLPKKNIEKINLGIILVLVILIAKETLAVVRQTFLIRQARAFNTRIIDFFYRHLLQLPKPFFDSRKIGDFTARLNDTSRIQKVISQLAGSTIIDFLIVLVTTGFLLSYSIKIGIVCIAAMPMFYYLVYKHNKAITNGQKAVMVGYAQVEANYISSLQGIEPIKNHNKQDQFADSNNTIYQEFQTAIFKLGKIQISLSFLANSFSVIFLIGILFYGSHQVLDKNLRIGELIAILTMCGTLLPSVANLALISIPINEAKIAFDRMFEFAGTEPEKKDDTKNTVSTFESLKAHDIAFRFAGRSQLLTNVSLEVSKGEIIAIMGENGSGKSTISQIIQKHYLPEKGVLIINDNIPLDTIQFNNWRNLCTIVPQNIHIFNGTVLENIAFDKATDNPQEVVQFLHQYGFVPFMDSLPQSIFTLVGEEGINLSGGQKQMIALARALYAKPQLLILDEVTAAMDRDSEYFVLNLLTQLKKSTAIIFITHRLHILKTFCDRIYLLEKGVITTAGNHDTLLQTNNLYSKYWRDIVS